MVEKKEAEIKKRPSRAKSVCPLELAQMIDLLNLIPPDMTIAPLERQFEPQIAEYKKKHLLANVFDGHPEPLLLNVLKETIPAGGDPLSLLKYVLQTAPQEFQDYIFNEPPLPPYTVPEKLTPDDKFMRCVGRLSEFCAIQDALRALVIRLEFEKNHPETRFFYWSFFPIQLRTFIRRDEITGRLAVSGLAGLLGTFDDRRLRKCVVCNRIFWAKREDSKTCSRPCLNVANVRRFRSMSDEEKAERKAQRTANRNLIKTGKAKPKTRGK